MERVLLHTCCAPCSLSCIDPLRSEGIEPVAFWYNPNIHPWKEYQARRDCLVSHAPTIVLEGRSFTNHNKLLWQYDGADGVKTGYTQATGRILVSSAVRDGRRLIAVTMDDGNDWADHAALLDYGFAQLSEDPAR